MDSPKHFESSRTPADAFREAVAIIGGQSATSRLIGLSQQAISDRLAKGQSCPANDGAVLKVERRSGISRHELRPDIYPDERTPATAHLDNAAAARGATGAMEPAR